MTPMRSTGMRTANARRVLLGTLCAAFTTCATVAAAADYESSSTILIETRGQVKASAEVVAFKGPVQIGSRTVTDARFGAAPTVELSIDMSGVVGLGSTSGNKYTTQSREVVSVPLRSDADVAIDFPFESSNAKGSVAFAVGHANFKLFFVGATGSLASGRGWIDSPALIGTLGK